jgi:SAM-dependent methyltransferase
MNDLAGKARAEVADLLDAQLSPLGLRAIEALSPQIGEAVLDVGCGAGQSVLQLADRVGPRGRVTGVDIAPPLLEVARRRAVGRSQVDFIECDALRLALPERSIDCVFSRFGVMAFRDPVAAFSNFRRMMRPRGRLAFVCWRSLDENELVGQLGNPRRARLVAQQALDTLVWGFRCQGVRQGGEAFLRRFLGSISKPVSSSRPAHR